MKTLNPTARKLRKLVRDPRLFFADLARKRIPELRTAEELRDTRPFAYLDSTPQPDTPRFSFEALIERLAQSYPLLFTVDEMAYRVGVLEAHLVGILQECLRFARKHDLRLEARMFARLHSVEEILEERLLRDLRRGESLELLWSRDETALLRASFCLYRLRDQVLVNNERRILLRHIPRAATDELLSGRKGVIHPIELFSRGEAREPTQQVDIVYTWVNSRDPGWQALHRSHFGSDIDEDRFLSRDELKYSLRSVSYYCDWVRKIHVVTNCAAPDWLDLSHPKIAWVDHREVLEPGNLPTFNCHAIEVGLLDVPDLADHFIYFNDDVFVTVPLRKAAFFDSHGRSRAYFEPNGKLAPDRSNSEESWFHARLNAQQLLFEPYGYVASRMHHHCPFAINTAHAREMFAEFGEEVTEVATHKQRQNDDIPLLSFLYPHYTQARGIGLATNVDSRIMNLQNFERFKLGPNTQFLCINDGVGSADHDGFDEAARTLMEDMFPIRAPWER